MPTLESLPWNTTGVLRLFMHDSIAQGCPVGDHQILTARHVGTRDYHHEPPAAVAAIWSTVDGVTGIAWTEDFDYRRDLALMVSETPLPHVYRVSDRVPSIGDRVLMVGYEKRRHREPLGPRRIETRVRNIVSAHLILADPGEGGFSGSCVLNFRNEVVGVFHSAVSAEQGAYGIASLVVGEWREVGWTPPRVGARP